MERGMKRSFWSCLHKKFNAFVFYGISKTCKEATSEGNKIMVPHQISGKKHVSSTSNNKYNTGKPGQGQGIFDKLTPWHFMLSAHPE